VELLNFFFDEPLEASEIHLDNCSGAFGQRITNIEIKIDTQERVKSFILKISGLISENDKKYLYNSFSQRIDEKLRFYFRIKKQALAISRFEIVPQADVVQFIFHFQNKTPQIKIRTEMLMEYLQNLGII